MIESPWERWLLSRWSGGLACVEGGSAAMESGHRSPRSGRIAGIDFGTVRIGVAIAELSVAIASPYENYRRVSPEADAEYFRRLAADEAIDRFVVGLPVHLSGHESGKSAEARHFGRWLAEVTGVPVEFFDERLTTVEAEAHLLDARLTRKQRRARLDKLAAQIMLTAYLESRARGGEGIEPL